MSILRFTPQFSVEQSLYAAQEHFGFQALTSTALESERDQNFLLTNHESQRFVLKISNSAEDPNFVAAQNQMLRHLEDKFETCPKILLSIHGNECETLNHDGQAFLVRLVSFVEGTPLVHVGHVSDGLLFDLGCSIGRLTNSLVGFSLDALERDFHWDLANAERVVTDKLHFVEDEQHRDRIRNLIGQFQIHTQPSLEFLPKSALHNDANDGNVIAGLPNKGELFPNSINGIIDFGDAIFSWTVGELAIAIAYAILDKDDPLAVAMQITKGYRTQRKLTDHEVDALFGLVCARLCASSVIAHEQHQSRPDDPYLMVSQGPINRTLPKLEKIPFRFAAACLRHANGQPAVPHHARVVEWISANARSFVFPVNPQQDGVRPDSSAFCILDLSVTSPLLAQLGTSISEPAMTELLENKVESEGCLLGVGQYLEPRLLYQAKQFGKEDWSGKERRTIHLGIDIFSPAGTSVVSAFAGQVAYQDIIDLPLDYGGLLIVQHETTAGDPFFLLYGHLDPASLSHHTVGDKIESGQVIASLGKPSVNGGWTPHLHFQVILDLLGYDQNVPGVCEASREEIWKQISPAPNLILGIDTNRFPQPAIPLDETLVRRKKRIGSNLSLGYKEPIKVVRGDQHFLFDQSGRRYIDAYNNVPHVGHANRAVTNAVHRQMSLLNTNTRYLHDNINNLAERISATLPQGLDVCYFVSSASEANELALRLARAHTGQKDLIVLEGAYHGHTTTLIDISPYKHDGPGGRGRPDWVHLAPVADIYRGEYKDAETAGELYAQQVAKTCSRQHGKLCGFIAESCPSVGGQILFPRGYLKATYEFVRAAGGICIADDVQTGYGRLGDFFYGFEQQEVSPDIVVLGKPIGNGHPLAAVITKREIADSFANGMEFFATFGGNTVSCAAGLAVLDVLHSEQLQKNAFKVGGILLQGLRELQQQFDIIGDVRGSGLFLGVELVRDRDSLEPADIEARFIANRMRELGVLIGTDGPLHNVLKIRPPMTFDADSARALLHTFHRALIEVSNAPRRLN